jgi:hypothetical protein
MYSTEGYSVINMRNTNFPLLQQQTGVPVLWDIYIYDALTQS